MTRLIALAIALAACTPQQAQQVQNVVTIACVLENAAAPVAITVAPKQSGDIAKADSAAKAACAAMGGLVLTAPAS